MKLFLSTAILSLFSISLYSQFNQSAHNKLVNARIEAEIFFEQYGISEEDLKNIKGSPYEVDYFQPGNLFEGTELKVSKIPMRYNIFSDEIEVKSSFQPNDTDINVLTTSPDYIINIVGNTYVYVLNTVSKDKSGYFKVLHEGDHYDLYKKSSITYIEKKFAETNYQQDQPARFDRTDTYYMVNKQGRFLELTTSKRKFLNAFGSEKKKVENYIKEHKLSIKDEGDMAKIFSYYNSIL
ncbi:hypothetical protein [uncultured Planktosalinus sp.]|uniref:hypothetical protein n=1 Tax=uncultured Planktosalinus sp. TaxID=1810935 RepID=UPI0030DD2E62